MNREGNGLWKIPKHMLGAFRYPLPVRPPEPTASMLWTAFQLSRVDGSARRQEPEIRPRTPGAEPPSILERLPSPPWTSLARSGDEDPTDPSGSRASRSWMVNAGSRPIRPAYSRNRRAPTLWKVPAHGNPSLTRVAWRGETWPRCAVRDGSSHRRRGARMSGGARNGSHRARRAAPGCAVVLVLPVPAPAMISSGSLTRRQPAQGRQRAGRRW